MRARGCETFSFHFRGHGNMLHTWFKVKNGSFAHRGVKQACQVTAAALPYRNHDGANPTVQQSGPQQRNSRCPTRLPKCPVSLQHSECQRHRPRDPSRRKALPHATLTRKNIISSCDAMRSRGDPRHPSLSSDRKCEGGAGQRALVQQPRPGRPSPAHPR